MIEGTKKISCDFLLSNSTDVLIVNALINNTTFDLLIDTGASSNYISKATLEILLQSGINLKFGKIAPVEISLADATKISASGKVSLEINLDNKCLNVDFIIVDSLLFDLIVGCRFCRENKVIIDFFYNSISFLSSDESI